jgi:hypothetical protein
MKTRDRERLGLTAREIASSFAEPGWAVKYPPILSVHQAAQLLQVSPHTIYAWSSQGFLKGCGRRIGKHLRFFRDRLVSKVFNEGLYE